MNPYSDLPFRYWDFVVSDAAFCLMVLDFGLSSLPHHHGWFNAQLEIVNA